MCRSTTEGAVGVEIGGDREVGEVVGKNLKNEGRECRGSS